MGLLRVAKNLNNRYRETVQYYIIPENCFIVVHVLVNKKEFQILDQRDGNCKGNVLSDFHFALTDSTKSESGSPSNFWTAGLRKSEICKPGIHRWYWPDIMNAVAYLKNRTVHISHQHQFNKRVKKLQCDNGKEYLNTEIYDFIRQKGIQLLPCPPYVHELNDVAERYNRTAMDIGRCLLINYAVLYNRLELLF